MMIQVSTGPPMITIHPTSQLIKVGTSITLTCKGTGRGSIMYQWEIKSSSRVLRNTTGETLRVRNLQESHQYWCVVSNEAGEMRSNVTTVTVLSKFSIFH